ncbi:MAG: TIGR02444 family protein, partial [Amphiplicatus sp.]
MTDDFPFWTFSLAVYGRGGVPEACLALQEAYGIDVNLLLFCCWAGAGGTALDEAAMKRCADAAGAWHGEIVRGLRTVRQRLKGGFGSVRGEDAEALRRKILGLELEAEKIEQGLLAGTMSVPAAPAIPADEFFRGRVENALGPGARKSVVARPG